MVTFRDGPGKQAKMSIHLRENQYRGVNAHLQSHFQSEGGWEMFHAAHITHLAEKLDTLLPEGYYALNEKSLQLSAMDFESGDIKHSRMRPDITILREAFPDPTDRSPQSGTPFATLPLIRIALEDDPLDAVLIYQEDDANTVTLVTRLEVLSPTNKPPGSHYRQYLRKRNDTLNARINLVEVDYLHETRLPTTLLPIYPYEVDSAPYLILVNRPSGKKADEKTLAYQFSVDSDIPIIDIPLAGKEVLPLDMNPIYNQTFASNRYYGIKLVDYSELPVRFDSYSPADQQRIRERMTAIAQEHNPE
jgi:Protein of unknown function (DUF4058)